MALPFFPLVYGQVLTAGQWNALFNSKQDDLGYTPLNVAGGTMLGRLITAPSTDQLAGLVIQPGIAPSSPTDGDIWVTTAGIYVRVDGATVGPLVSSGTITGVVTLTGDQVVGGIKTFQDAPVLDDGFTMPPVTSPHAGFTTTTATTPYGTPGTVTGVTASTTSGSTAITLSVGHGLSNGTYITIAGVAFAFSLSGVGPTSATLSRVATATVAGAAVQLIEVDDDEIIIGGYNYRYELNPDEPQYIHALEIDYLNPAGYRTMESYDQYTSTVATGSIELRTYFISVNRDTNDVNTVAFDAGNQGFHIYDNWLTQVDVALFRRDGSVNFYKAQADLSVKGVFTSNCAFQTYTADGLFNADARPSTIFTPAGDGSATLFGYADGGGGQFSPRVGFYQPAGTKTAAKASIGLANNGDLTIGGGAANATLATFPIAAGKALVMEKATAGATTDFFFGNNAAAAAGNVVRLLLGTSSGFSGLAVAPYIAAYRSGGTDNSSLELGVFNDGTAQQWALRLNDLRAATFAAGVTVTGVLGPDADGTRDVGAAGTAWRNIFANAMIPTGSTVPTNGLYLAAANSPAIASNSTKALGFDSSQNAIFAAGVKVSGQYPVPYILDQSGLAVVCPADTNEDVLATITIPANAMGANGSVTITFLASCTVSANAKTLKVYFGGLGGMVYCLISVSATQAAINTQRTISNANATNSQVGYQAASPTTFGGSTTGAITSAIDTTVSQTIVITGQKGTAGEALTLLSYSVTLNPHA